MKSILFLNKVTVSNLDNLEMQTLKGGQITFGICPPPSHTIPTIRGKSCFSEVEPSEAQEKSIKF